jgi:hypothetical protein
MTTVLAAIVLTQAPSFAQLEKQKVDAFTKLTGFRGTYVMVSLPQEGVGIRQEVTLTISPDGRRTKLFAEGQDVAESAYNKKTKWTAFLYDKTYELNEPPEGFSLPPDIPPLTPKTGEMSLTLDDLGPRFATNPPPEVTAPTTENIDGKPYTRYDAKTISPSQKSQVQITQWFDPKTFIIKQFEITKTTDGRVSKIKGFLIKEDLNAKIAATEFDLPANFASTFRRINPKS